MNKRNKFWCYNWLVIVAVGLLFWICYRYWSLLYSHSPLLILAHVFLLYLLVLKLLLNNIKCFNRLLDGASVSGWSFFKEFIRPFAYVYRKCGAGIDLLTRRMGAEQELIIAEKERKKLEVVLSQRELYEKLAQYPVPPKDDPGKEEDTLVVDKERRQVKWIPWSQRKRRFLLMRGTDSSCWTT